MEKKEEILINAAMIICEEGIQKLTMDYVAKKSNITKGGVLYHFNSKTNLLLQMNKLAIDTFEKGLEKYQSTLTGQSIFTRAYAYATLDYLKDPAATLLPAVIKSYIENKESYQLWEETLTKWEQLFQQDSGDYYKNLQLRLVCDGIWFSMVNTTNPKVNKEMESIVERLCTELEGVAE